jgi:succinate dehydrogenase / fumarate reductase flavoprotein subunit/fumarate reductase flavoprotein subunit
MYARSGAIAVQPGRRMNLEWQAALDVRNLIEVARLIARSARLRDESRGSHYRADFPRPDNARWLRNIYLTRQGADGAVREETRPVALSRLQPPLPATPASAS